MLIVQTSHGSTQRFDTGGRPVLPRRRGDRNGGRTGEAALDLIVSLGGALAQIGPARGILGVTVLGGSLRAPDYTCGCPGRIETSVGAMALVGGAELAMSFGPLLWEKFGPLVWGQCQRGCGKIPPFSESPLLCEKRRVEGRRILTRRPENDISWRGVDWTVVRGDKLQNWIGW